MSANESDNVITVKILDRSYRIKCPSNQAPALKEAAEFVDSQMRKARQSGNVMSTDRIAVVTALNICHDFLELKKHKSTELDTLTHRIGDLQTKLSLALVEDAETVK